MKIFFNYSIDCELPPDGRFGGPATWQIAEASTRGFLQVMSELGVLKGASLFVYPDVAVKQKKLYREIADSGIEIGLHLHGMRYSRLAKSAWLGSLPYREQLKVVRMAKRDLEEVVGKPCLGYRACYASANHFTFPLLEELGFIWTSTSAAGSYKPEIFACWAGGWPFPYHPSRENKLIPGNLKIYEIPLTRGIRIYFEGNPDRPLDMRAETPPEVTGRNGEMFKKIIAENILEMERRDQPIRTIIGASHNANLFADKNSHQYQNLVWVYQHTLECAQRRGYSFLPANFLEIKTEADHKDAF